MSWSIRAVGTKVKIKEAVIAQFGKSHDAGDLRALTVADSLCAAVDAFGDNEALILDLDSSGHVDASGYGNFRLSIQAQSKSIIVN